jgi:hypothetical protein
MPNDFGRKGKANMRLETGTASGNAKPTLQAPTAIATCSWKSPWGIAAKKEWSFWQVREQEIRRLERGDLVGRHGQNMAKRVIPEPNKTWASNLLINPGLQRQQ